MKSELKYILKVSIILALVIFVVERLLFGGGFILPIDELIRLFGINLMYAFVLTFLNSYFYVFLESKFTWKENSKKRLIIGAFGSVLITMIGLVLLRFITLVIVLSYPIENFLRDENAEAYYTFGLVITIIISIRQ